MFHNSLNCHPTDAHSGCFHILILQTVLSAPTSFQECGLLDTYEGPSYYKTTRGYIKHEFFLSSLKNKKNLKKEKKNKTKQNTKKQKP